jgi:hypothetical protein
MTEDHLKFAELLLQYGALVDETVLKDHNLEKVGSEEDRSFSLLLEAHKKTNP